MKKVTLLAAAAFFGIANTSHAQLLKGLKKNIKTAVEQGKSSSSALSEADYIKGLKEVLQIAAKNSTSSASMVDGYFKNRDIKIPFPNDAIAIRNYAVRMGLQPQVDLFEEKLNRAAELAAQKAAPVFLSAIQKMTVTDAVKIATGERNAATQYLRKTTGLELVSQFQPIVADALNSVAITKYWKPLADSYNKVSPFLGKESVNADLQQYVTQKAVDGLFVLIEREEAKVRQEPMKYGSALVEKIFKAATN